MNCRGLARAIHPEESVDLALVHREIDAVNRRHFSKMALKSSHFKDSSGMLGWIIETKEHPVFEPWVEVGMP